MQSLRLQNDIDDIQRRIGGVNMKLTAEMKVCYYRSTSLSLRFDRRATPVRP